MLKIYQDLLKYIILKVKDQDFFYFISLEQSPLKPRKSHISFCYSNIEYQHEYTLLLYLNC